MFTRVPEGYRSDRRRGLLFVAAVVAAVYLFLSGLSTIWTDFLWFDSVGFTEVWRVKWFYTVALGAIGALIVFAVVWGNLLLTDRLSPRYELLNLGEEEEIVERFRDWVEPRLRMVRLLIAVAFAILLGVGVAAWRDDVLLFLNSQSFGMTDPQFDLDLGFYIFRLPLWTNIVSWLFNLSALTLLLVAAIHYLNGGIRLQRGGAPTIRFPVKVHLSVLVAVLALLRAVAYRLDTYELLYSNNGGVFGAGYTDVNARLPALNLLALVSVLAAVLFIVNIWRPGWTLAIVSAGSWLFISIAAGVVYPAIVQRFTVQPNELVREGPFIEHNIAFTRSAYGLNEVEVREFAASPELTVAQIEANRTTVDNLRLWDPDVLTRTYQQLQEIRTYYRVDRVDTDRYRLEDAETQVMVAVRELDEPGIPAQDWQNQRLVYTHGFGAVLSPANEVEVDGQPDFLLRDVPPVTEVPRLQLEQPRVYFGETYNPDKPVIVRTGDGGQEIDLPSARSDEGASLNQYDGVAGVQMDGFMRRLAFALRYRDLNILISSQLRPDSRVLMERNLVERVNAVAPFLAADADPYPVVLDGRVEWVLDMYTISETYPYSQPVGTRGADTDRLSRRSGLPFAGFNYMRNSVKAVVDAYDGTLRLYVFDPEDPIIQAWRQVYPTLFLEASAMPAELREHLRYPEDLFKIQSELYLDYHMVDRTQFFQRNDAWEIPPDPSTIDRRTDPLRGDRQNLSNLAQINYLSEMLPYYLLMRLPGEVDTSYVLLQPFNPLDKPNMASFLVADSTPGRYGRLIDYRMPRGSLVDGPGQVGNRIDQDPIISQQKSLWNTQGSTVLFGDMLVVPVEDSIVYVEPVYLEAEQGGLPEFRKVVVVHGDQIEWADTLDQALAAIFGDGIGVTEPPPTQPPPLGSAQELLDQALASFQAAQQALRSGDLAEYQRLIDEAQRLVEEARRSVAPDTTEARARTATVG